MKRTAITIQNLKCGGCATQIKSKLTKLEGIADVSIDEMASTVSFSYQDERTLVKVTSKLRDMGYPEFDDENSLGEKAMSYVSCMIGRVKKESSS